MREEAVKFVYENRSEKGFLIPVPSWVVRTAVACAVPTRPLQ